MKLYHATALALLLAFGIGCTRHPPASGEGVRLVRGLRQPGMWRLLQVPLKPCVAPASHEPNFLGYFNDHAQCADIAAPPSKWCSVSIGKRSVFDSQADCLDAVYGDVWVVGPYGCIRKDDPRWIGQKPCTCIYKLDDDLSHCFSHLNGK